MEEANGVATKVAYGGGRIDPPIDANCPTGILVRSGRWLSVPRPDTGEMFMGYCLRVSRQLGNEQGVLNALATIQISMGPIFAKLGGQKEDGSNWAEAADMFFNKVYTPGELAAAKQELEDAQKVYGGVFSAVGSVNKDEARMLYAANRLLHQKTEGRGGEIFYHHNLLEGQVKDIANWINTGEPLYNQLGAVGGYEAAFELSKTFPNIRPEMREMVDNIVKEAKKLS